MNEREKIAHLLRRFGLGAGKTEVDAYLPLGVDGAIERLIDYDKVDEGFPVDPWEVTGYGEGLIQYDPAKFGAWWALRMFLTKRPLQERMTLFWHNHFAVSATKVADGPNMLAYMETLRKHATGNFRDLLHATSKTAAMIFYLDTHQSVKGHPNENFAREVMELFTLGQGHYTEKDIQEAARAFTGWSIHYMGIGGETDYAKLAEQLARQGRSPLSFCIVPDLHDETPKTIFGKTANYDGDGVLDLLLEQPRTSEFIASKVAAWFVDGALDPAFVASLAKTFRESNYEIKPLLRAIAKSDAFWSAKNVAVRPKSPIDYYVATFRQLGVAPIILALRGEVKDKFKPMRAEVKGVGDGLYFLMNREGLLLLYPPSVAGWEWGKAWMTTSNMASRMTLPETLMRGEDKNRPISQIIANRLKTEYKVANEEAMVSALLEIFDGVIPNDKRDLLVEACVASGGVKALEDKEQASIMLSKVMALLAATPEFQVC